MPLSPGHRLGPYEIVAPIGAGGMGEVYRARDTRLDRTVAIKVNAEQFSERFEREARAVAALNHPNICTLFDVGPNYLVMEFIDGQTLDRITPPAGMRLADALKIAVNIAAGLAAAHALGIVHRDLKPGNVMVTSAGVVKLLDFGLAAIDTTSLPTGAGDATRTVLEGPKTVQGTILGTVSYMSPEQAEGRKLDTRSDIFSFGSLLYEMVTGQRAFKGETTVSTLAAILNKEPTAAASLVAWLPVDLDRIITRCLRKDPDRRFQHASDLRVELQELVDAQSSGALAAQPAAPATGRRTRSWAPALIALAIAGGLAGGWFLHRPPPPFQGPTLTRATYDNGLSCDPALSPDGKLLVYASDRAGKGNLDIWMQPTAGGDPVQLTRDEADESEPSFSPDGSQIVFRSEREGGGLYRIAALGGEARLLAREGRNPHYSPDGAHIAYWTGRGGRSDNLARQGGRIWVIPAEGGEPRQLAGKISWASTPVWSPDSRTLLFVGIATIAPNTTARRLSWYLTSLADDQPAVTNATEVLPPAAMPSPAQWLPSNHIIFAETGTDRANLYRVALDAAGKRLSGKPERLTFGGGVETAPSMAPNGTVALADLTWNFDIWSLPVDTRNARVTGQPVRVTESLAADVRPSLSADGTSMAYATSRQGQNAIWSLDFKTGRTARLVANQPRNISPAVSPDGSQVLYSQPREGRLALFTIPFSGGISQRILDDSGNGGYWSGRNKIAHLLPGFPRNISVLDPNSKQDRPLLQASKPIYQAYFSPDEAYVAFMQVNTPQTAQVFLAPATGKWPIPESEWIRITDGKEWDDKPQWSPDGNVLYFTSDRDRYRCIWAQRLEPGTRRPAGAPFAVAHFHSARQSMLAVGVSQLELAVGPDKIVFVQGEVTGNVWLANRPQ